MSCTQPYTLRQGETRKPTVTVFDVNGDLQDLTGATIEFQVKPKPGDDDTLAVITKTSPTGITISDQTTNKGQLVINIDSSDTATLAGGVFFYDVVAILSGGDRSVVIPPSPFIVVTVVNTV